LVLAVFAAAGSAAAARAELVTTFQGTIPSQDVAMRAFTREFTANPVGPFRFTVDEASTDPNFAPNSDFRSFCADLFQDVSPGQTYTYTVGSVSDLSSVGGDATKAALVSRLFNRHYEAATDADFGGAFQLTLWELLADGPGNLDLTTGNLTVTTPDSVPAVGIAKSWLAALETADPTDSEKYQLVGLFSATVQDQLTVVPNPIPAPAGAVLGLIAVGGFALRRLRRTR
jgi:hypothetical protein